MIQLDFNPTNALRTGLSSYLKCTNDKPTYCSSAPCYFRLSREE
jgi:hypothetical protein